MVGTDRGRRRIWLAAVIAAVALASGCALTEEPEPPAKTPGVVIDTINGERIWVPSRLAEKLGDPEAGGTGPVAADEGSVLAALKRRTAELDVTRKQLEQARSQRDEARTRVRETADELKATRATLEEREVRIAALEQERAELIARVLDAELARVASEQELVQLRLSQLEESP